MDALKETIFYKTFKLLSKELLPVLEKKCALHPDILPRDVIKLVNMSAFKFDSTATPTFDSYINGLFHKQTILHQATNPNFELMLSLLFQAEALQNENSTAVLELRHDYLETSWMHGFEPLSYENINRLQQEFTKPAI